MPVFVIENMQTYRIVSFDEDFWAVTKALTYMLMYLNHVINFFSYCLLGPKFRNEVKKLRPFKWIFKEKEKDSIYPLKISKRATYFQASTVSDGTLKKECEEKPAVHIMSAIESDSCENERSRVVVEVSEKFLKDAQTVEC